MSKDTNHRVRATALLAAGLLSLSAVPATAAAPVRITGSQTFAADTLCDFAVRLDFQGKTKTIGPEDGTHKVLSPGFKVTTTALDANGRDRKSATYTATGTLFYTLTPRAKGPAYFEVKATGQNLLFVPQPDGSTALIYVTGNVNFAVELDKATEVRTFSGAARQLNICEPLS